MAQAAKEKEDKYVAYVSTYTRNADMGIHIYDVDTKKGRFTEKDKVAYADSAYVGQELPEHVEAQICEKGYRNHPLTEEQKQNNRRKSKIRCRIEHVFGFMTGSMHGITLRTIGIKRAKFNIGLTNLIYNICRYSIISRKSLA